MDLFAQIARLVEEGRAFVIATVVDTAGSTPQKPGARMVVLEDGSLLGTIGGGAIEKQVVDAARALFGEPRASRLLETHLTHELGMCCGGRMKVFLDRQSPAAQLVIFGAGHVGRALAQSAGAVGFRVTVVDARPRWANPERFAPPVTLVVADPADVARGLPGGPSTYFCVTTHDHPLDQAVVEALLRKPFAYLGLIGSARKAARFKLRLKAAGFSDDALALLRSPMGLPIEAQTPEEIAVSIAAELVQVRAKRAPVSRRVRLATAAGEDT